MRLVGTEYQALTDARGHYRIGYSGSPRRLSFSKSGYAPVEAGFEDGHRVAVDDATLWKLPQNAGVYLYERDRYHQTGWVLPKQYLMDDGSVSFGTQRTAETMSASGTPFIVCYRTPRYDARLTRLVESKAKRAASNKGTIPVWTSAGSLAADLIPIDPLQGQLLKLRLNQELEPGIYAIHWGAMEGYVTLDSRVFLFEVAEPPPPPEPEVLGVPDSVPDALVESTPLPELKTTESSVEADGPVPLPLVP